MPRLVRLIVAASLLITAVACDDGAPEEPQVSASMKIGLMLNFSGVPETAADRKRAFDLAIRHVKRSWRGARQSRRRGGGRLHTRPSAGS